MSATAVVRARIDEKTKRKATKALAKIGLTVSDAIRLTMVRIADEKTLPFELYTPNAESREAIRELQEGRGQRFATVEEFMADLNARD
ncbi:type II toxin-antitoxin system RelB/DinJ family antitoxin [soil metagenome]